MTFQFKIQIKNIKKPPVWRRVVVPSNFTFSMFHTIIQAAMGWTDTHLYSFSQSGYGSHPWIEEEVDEDDIFSIGLRNEESLSATKVMLSDIFEIKGETFTYIYDFGDDWIHKITLEEIDFTNIQTKPKLIAGKGACPPEDCGGAWGYENLKEILTDKNHPEHGEMTEWFLGYYDDNEGEDDEQSDLFNPHEYNLEEEIKMFDETFE